MVSRLVGNTFTELEMFSGRTIDVPACFISGKSDWGVYQSPGALERWKPRPVLNGAGRTWSRARDIGFSKSSRRKSVDY